jgi:hypothetical protein
MLKKNARLYIDGKDVYPNGYYPYSLRTYDDLRKQDTLDR